MFSARVSEAEYCKVSDNISVGLNLTVASRVIIIEPWWNPYVEDQGTAVMLIVDLTLLLRSF